MRKFPPIERDLEDRVIELPCPQARALLRAMSRAFAFVLSVGLVSATACGSSSSSGDGDDGTSDAGSAIPSGADPGSPPSPGPSSTSDGGPPSSSAKIETVFVIVMENHSWDTIKASDSAKYINDTLVPMGAHAEQYTTPPGNHPSEPNYIWMEAGDNLGITTDDDPDKNHKSGDHLTAQLEKAGISWKAYAEDIDGKSCPLSSKGLYGAKHTPQLFFDDVTGTNDASSQHCIDHVRPYAELATDLQKGTVARYNFITPNLCNDMHGEVGIKCPFVVSDLIKKGDDWLAAEVPKILASQAYKNDGVLFVMWDEGDESLGSEASDGPIPFIVLSPRAKKGYASPTPFTHSSYLRTIETIFGVPFLRGAQNAKDLSEMFTSFP